jgi:hypothetical protein
MSLPMSRFCQDCKRTGISRLLKGKGQGAVLAKKGQFASYKEKPLLGSSQVDNIAGVTCVRGSEPRAAPNDNK